MNTSQSVLVREDFTDENGYRDLILGFKQHLSARGLRDGELEGLLSSLGHTHGAAFRRTMRTTLRQFYASAKRTGRITEDPAADLAPIRVPLGL